MPDKGLNLSDFGSALLQFTAGNGTMTLNIRPKHRHFVVFIVLY